jgi:DNA-binding IclR family transcriptional regulator
MTEAATLTPTARLVLAVLHPSAEPLTYTDLAARTGASLWTLQDLLPTLVSTGYLTREKHNRQSFFTIAEVTR